MAANKNQPRTIMAGEDIDTPFPIEGMLPWEVMFCQELVANGFIQYRAMQKARPGLGPRKSVLKAQEVLRRTDIRQYIRHQLITRATRLSITSDMTATKYWEWINADITEFVEYVQPKKSKTNSKSNPKPYLALKSDLKDLSDSAKSAIKSITTTKEGRLKVELVDKKGALDSLNKQLGFMEHTKVSLDAETIILHFDSQDEEA